MAEVKYEHFIPQNTALAGARRIGVYDSKGNRVGGAGLQGLALPTTQPKQYGFMCLADCHIKGADDTLDATVDFVRAMKYAEADSGIDFTTICGDVVDTYNAWLIEERYPQLRNANTTKPVYAVSGNHESGNLTVPLSDAHVQAGFGHPLFYSFARGNDVFIMLGQSGWAQAPVFADGELQFLYDTLETNRNKRCFVFYHNLNCVEGDSGQPFPTFYTSGPLYANGDVSPVQWECFLSLLRHYKNAIWFHGHSHSMFHLQEMCATNTYSEECGYKSVHIPSLAYPTDCVNGVRTSMHDESQGYVVDVYPDGIHLRGRDFVKGEFLPIGSYWIDTTLQNVSAGTYTDSTGLLTT